MTNLYTVPPFPWPKMSRCCMSVWDTCKCKHWRQICRSMTTIYHVSKYVERTQTLTYKQANKTQKKQNNKQTMKNTCWTGLNTISSFVIWWALTMNALMSQQRHRFYSVYSSKADTICGNRVASHTWPLARIFLMSPRSALCALYERNRYTWAKLQKNIHVWYF